MIAPASDPLREGIDLELSLWNHIPKLLSGRKVKDVEELNRTFHYHPDYQKWGDAYLRQHRSFRFYIKPAMLRHLERKAVEIELGQNGLTKGYDIYSIPASNGSAVFHNVSYKCHECSVISIEKPIVENDECGVLDSPLFGGKRRPRITYFCGNCKIEIDNFIFDEDYGNSLSEINRWSLSSALDKKDFSTLTRNYGS